MTKRQIYMKAYNKKRWANISEDEKNKKKAYLKEYYQKNKEKLKQKSLNWAKENQEKKSQYKENNIEQIKEYDRQYYQENKERKKAYKRKKWNTDTEYKLRNLMRVRINQYLKKGNKIKYIDALGCSIKEWMIYLEKQFDSKMSWDNHGTYWEIDHIKPLSKGGSFHYTNTQPLIWEDNRSKSAKLI